MKFLRSIPCLTLTLLCTPAWGAAPDLFATAPLIPVDQNTPMAPSGPPVDFLADHLVHDDATQVITATGNVEFAQDGRILKADEVQYDMVRDIVTAHKNVILTEKNGDVHFADDLQLTDDMKQGYVRALHTTLADGSRFTAASGERKNGRKIIMKEATYTPCEPCKLHPERSPVWRLRASKVTHDNVEKTIGYENARLEMWGVPVFYTPYFYHPDGTVKQKSGLLTPTLKFDSQNGTSVSERYYWAIDPTRDATFGLEAYTSQAPRATAEFRQRLDRAEFEIAGSTTYSERTDSIGDDEIQVPEEMRGHIEGQARWDMNDKWRSGVHLNLASDDQYFRQYDITNKDVIENEIYAERFDKRNYTVIRGLAFQDLRTSTRATDQPNILPEVQATFLGDPGQTLGGRWAVTASALGLERSGGTDLARASLEGGWQGRHIADMGLVTTLDTTVRGDIYHVADRAGATTSPGVSKTKSLVRAFPMAQVTTSMPFVKPMQTADLLFEPIAAVTLVTNQEQGDRISNEDSQDIQLDTSNLFEPNRFPGFDRVEDLSRATYGMRSGLNWHDGSIAEAFVGQSYRFKNRDSLFSENSGLATQASDFVGRVKVGYRDHFTLDYGVQLGAEDLKSVRHELDNYIRIGDFGINSRYLFAKEITGIGIDGSREQIQSYASYNLGKNWVARAGANYDLGVNSGLRKSVFGLDYIGQCLTFSATAQRSLTRESTGESPTEVFLRIGLKNLGEFHTSGISFGSTSSGETTNVKGLPNDPSK